MDTHPPERGRSRRTLRIAVVTETFPPEVNGVAATIALMLAGLVNRGHSVELIRPRQASDRESVARTAFEEVLVRGIPIPGYSSLRVGMPAANVLASRWRARRPDVVQVVTEGPLGWSAVRAARALRLPTASDFHTNFHAYTSHYRVGWLYRPIVHYLRALHNATAVTMVPTAELRECLSHCGFERVAVVSRGVDTRLFDPARRSEALRRSWGAAAGAPVVLHVSRLAAEKNLDLLFRCFEAMRAECPQARLVVVGDGPERNRLERRYPGHYYAGMLHGGKLAAHYASADIFLCPSITETFGNVTMEALASGLAVVAYDYAAARQHIRHGLNGLVAPFDNDDRFVRAAVALMQDPASIARLGQAARITAEAVDWERVLDDLEGVLVAVANGQPGGAAPAAALASGAAP